MHALIDNFLTLRLLRTGRGSLLLGFMEPVLSFAEMLNDSSDDTGVMMRRVIPGSMTSDVYNTPVVFQQ